MEGLCPCGHEPTVSIVPVSFLVMLLTSYNLNQINFRNTVGLKCYNVSCIRVVFNKVFQLY